MNGHGIIDSRGGFTSSADFVHQDRDGWSHAWAPMHCAREHLAFIELGERIARIMLETDVQALREEGAL